MARHDPFSRFQIRILPKIGKSCSRDCVLRVSDEMVFGTFYHHGETENTENAPGNVISRSEKVNVPIFSRVL